MAAKSEKAFENAQQKGIPIPKGGHGGHEAMGADQMTSSSEPSLTETAAGDMKGMDMSGMKHGDMKGMDMSSIKQGDMKGMDMSGTKHGEMKGMDMSGTKHGDMKGMDMSGTKHGDMKGMDMSGTKQGDMKGMDMSGMAMSPIVPQQQALQATAGQTAATLQKDPLDTPAASSVTAAQQSDAMNREMSSGGGMSMGTYVQHDVGKPSMTAPKSGMDSSMPGMDMNPSSKDHAMPAMQPSSQTGMGGKSKVPAPIYVCSSHPEIVRDRPGKCPVDGTPLVKKEKQP